MDCSFRDRGDPTSELVASAFHNSKTLMVSKTELNLTCCSHGQIGN